MSSFTTLITSILRLVFLSWFPCPLLLKSVVLEFVLGLNCFACEDYAIIKLLDALSFFLLFILSSLSISNTGSVVIVSYLPECIKDVTTWSHDRGRLFRTTVTCILSERVCPASTSSFAMSSNWFTWSPTTSPLFILILLNLSSNNCI